MAVEAGTADVISGSRPPVIASLAALALAATSIVALLAELYGVASMATVARYVTLPGTVGLIALGCVRRPELAELQRRMRVGAVAGIVGVIGYDVVRLPFSAAGMRVFAPVDSYGLLITNGHMASPWSNTLGWLFHLTNGIAFGVMYGVVAARRHWAFGVVWGLVLESAAFTSPFGTQYAIAGQTSAILLAYGAHLAYGYPVGRMVQRLDDVDAELHAMGRRTTTAAVVIAVLAIVVWHHPWSQPSARREAGRIAARTGQAVAVVRTDRFSPEWLRVNSGECVVVVNDSPSTFVTAFGTVAPHASSDLCFRAERTIANRVKLGTAPYSGGFVLVKKG